MIVGAEPGIPGVAHSIDFIDKNDTRGYLGSLLEQINDYSCSKIDDIVVEEDGDKIYVTTEYKTQLI